MSETVEEIIIRNLVRNEPFTRKVLPFLKEDYFTSPGGKVLFGEVLRFVEHYKVLPTIEALGVHIQARTDLEEHQYGDVVDTLEKVSNTEEEKNELKWLVDTTEEWVKDTAINAAIRESVHILDGKDKQKNKLIIPSLLADALAISFDTSVGHDYFKDADKRYDSYKVTENKLAFDIDLLNEITKGGLKSKTLTMFMAATGGGKSITMCHLASSYVAQGKNVLYLSLEMSEEEISRRIDANLMNVDSDEVDKLTKKQYLVNIVDMFKKFHGKLIVKEFPGGGVTNAGHFRFLIKELELKKKFKPDVILIDYLSLAGSSRYKNGAVNQSYYIKAVAEEIRGLGQEFGIPIISAAQYNREGMSSSDAELTDIAESIGITHTADLVIGLTRTEELDNMNQIMFKQLKNRYNDINHYRRFVLGVDLAKSKLYGLSKSAQDNILVEDTPPLMDNKFGPEKKGPKKKTKDFKGFKV